MTKLADSFKLSIADKLTQLAIENGLIPANTDVTVTATNVTKFFKTILETIDSNNEQ